MPSTSDRRTVQVALAAISVLVLAYSLVIAQQILLGVLAVGFCWLVYLLWRFVGVLERIAVALESASHRTRTCVTNERDNSHGPRVTQAVQTKTAVGKVTRRPRECATQWP